MPDQPVDFQSLAESYERLGEPLTGPFSREALALAALSPGATIADVAAGTGALAVPAASAGLTVRAFDLAPAMVVRLQDKLAAFPSSTAAVGDCTAIDLPDASVAAAFSIFGVAIVPVWKAGLAEMVRVTEPGGLVVVGAWLEDRGSKPFLVLRQAFARLYPERPFMPANSFPEWSAADLREALRAAGCAEAIVHERSHEVVKPSAAAAMADTMPFAAMVAGVRALEPADMAELEMAVIDGFRAYADADGTVRLPMEALIGLGRLS